jgi:hypothetical protein
MVVVGSVEGRQIGEVGFLFRRSLGEAWGVVSRPPCSFQQQSHLWWAAQERLGT